MTGSAALRPRGGTPSWGAAGFRLWLHGAGVVLAVVAVTLAVALPFTGPADSALSRLGVIAFAVGMVGLCLAGSVLLQEHPTHRMGWLLLATGLAGLLSRFAVGAAVASVHQGLNWPTGVLWLSNWIWVPAQLTLMFLLLRFPTGRPVNRGWRAVEAVVLLWAAAAIMVTALLPGPLGAEPLAHLSNPLGWQGAESVLAPALTPIFLAGNVLVAVCVAALVHRWIRGTGAQRRQLRTVLAACVFLGTTTPVAALGGVLEFAGAAAMLALPAAIAAAMVRDRLWGVERGLRTALVYASATAVLAACYLLVATLITVPGTPLLAALVVAVLALPVRNTVNWLLEKVLYGRRGDPARSVTELAAALRAATDAPATTLVRAVSAALKLPDVVLENAEGQVLAATRSQLPPGTAGALRLALQAAGEPAGWLVAGERSPGEGLDVNDRRVLADVAAQAALVAHGEALTAELAHSYAALVAAREDERARLQRELHDGLGPALAVIVMQAEAARNLAQADQGFGGRLESVLEGIGHAAEATVGDVRRIIEQLRPSGGPAVELQDGLVAAVEAMVVRLAPGLRSEVNVAEVRAEVAGARMGQDFELTLYKVAAEAVRNVAAHARATTVCVVVSVDSGAVTLQVDDDGVGLGPHAPGVGLRSMRERTEALGGTFTVADGPESPGVPGSPGGTRIRAHFPAVLP